MKTDTALTAEEKLDIAIIGLAGRFPGAKNIDEYWQNLCSGVESISFFSDKELKEAGLDPAVLKNPNYVKAAPILEDVELFDAAFFGYSPREAQFMDPQHRLFLECAWEALEQAGYGTEPRDRPIGVFAGAALNTYLLFSGLLAHFGEEYLLTLIGNDKDFLTTRVSYKLNLTGPSVTVQTACSTSLVAVHMACQSLLNGECDMALAGGVSVRVPQKAGYLYQEGSIFSPDGHCRAFDAKAKGTIFGSGVGIVVLKRLADAIADGDCIQALIKGSAINNDGSSKTNYTAPSVERQSEVIVEALAHAEVDAGTISYIETHGTGTSLGDPIEIEALTRAFRTYTQRRGYCAIGSVKTNIGHLDAAAGVAGMIKTILALKHKTIPASLHYEAPNPEIDFANSPFYVNSTFSEWKTGAYPRRAGVNALGVGGTNAHVILEEAPAVATSGSSRPYKLLLLSGKTTAAVDAATTNLVEYLQLHPDVSLADVAYTLQIGRKGFNYRRMVVCYDHADAISALTTPGQTRLSTSYRKPVIPDVVFMFPGQGAQYVNMARELYETEPEFRTRIDRCSEILQPHLDLDLRSILFPDESYIERASRELAQTRITQPAIFTIDYALAELWMSWGVHPCALIGHSLGEYVAACLAGVFSLEGILSLVATRGRLMQQLPGGSMLAVPLPEKALQPFLNKNLSLAVVNGPSLCVVSGEKKAAEDLEKQIAKHGVNCRYLPTSHAFHSAMMEPMLDELTEHVKRTGLKAPMIPFISNVTGTWITPDEAVDPAYWARHARQTVRFAEGIQELLKEPDRILLEVGPGRTLSTLAKQHPDRPPDHVVLPSLRHSQEAQSDLAFLLNILGRLWLAGVTIDWSRFYANEQRYRVPLPTHPFQRQRYWVETMELSSPATAKLQRHGGHNRDVSLSLIQWIRSTVIHNIFKNFRYRPRLLQIMRQWFVPTRNESILSLWYPKIRSRIPVRHVSPITLKHHQANDSAPESGDAYVAPCTSAEQIIAGIWQEALGTPRVGINDNFFELGGNSLLVTKIISQLDQIFKIELPMLSLLESPTVAELAQCIESVCRSDRVDLNRSLKETREIETSIDRT